MGWFSKNEKVEDNIEETWVEDNSHTVLKNNLFLDLDSCEFEVDFSRIDAFSIERGVTYHNVLGAVAVTVIGYFKEDGKIGEWDLFCSKDEHAKLVEKFRKANKLGDNYETVAKVSKKAGK